MDEHSSWAGRDERVFVYLPLERGILESLPAGSAILDLGCGNGSHLELLSTGGFVVGADTSLPALRLAGAVAPVVAAEGEHLPFAPESFDLVYVSHVLHHAFDPAGLLGEVRRVLKPGGRLMLIETCEDNPLMRLARTIRPQWESVPVRSRFRYAELLEDVRRAGFDIQAAEQFNVLYWVWGFARRHVRPLERMIDTVIRLELSAVRRLRRYSAYGYVVGSKPSI
jgi:SAM-dependent methyltransferase